MRFFSLECREGWGPVKRVNVDVGRSVVGEGGDTSVRTKHGVLFTFLAV